jgi:hypothetical protein
MSADWLSVLVLHSLGAPGLAPASVVSNVFYLQRYFPEHKYLYHDTNLPLPQYVSAAAFDAIILDVTFLCARWNGQTQFDKLRRDYAFVGDSHSVRIANPQDEYDSHLLLDDWMCEWKVDVVFSVVSSGWDVLYPRYCNVGDIRLGYTGYIEDSMLSRVRKPFLQRRIDIGYRAKRLPPYFGRIGENKWTIGRDVAGAAAKYGFKTDIVLGNAGFLLGDAWLEFLNDSKFTLGANSGSSLLDARGDIQRAVRSFVEKHPDASFSEVEANCFPGLDGAHAFTSISPRVIEAALLDSGQLMVDGEYSGIIKPWEHFIPIRSDASNFHEVQSVLRDESFVGQMIARCRETVLSIDDLRYRNKAKSVLGLIGDLKSRKNCLSNLAMINDVVLRYHEEMDDKYRALWRRRRLLRSLSSSLDNYPRLRDILRRTKHLVG